MARYGMTTTLKGSIEAVRSRVTDALKAEGFGILTEIDVQKTLKEKIGAELEPYLILGACNPKLAHQALSADRSIGLLLPCNSGRSQVEWKSASWILKRCSASWTTSPRLLSVRCPRKPRGCSRQLSAGWMRPRPDSLLASRSGIEGRGPFSPSWKAARGRRSGTPRPVSLPPPRAAF